MKINHQGAAFYCIKPNPNLEDRTFFNLKPSQMTLFAVSASFEYIECYGSPVIINILIRDEVEPGNRVPEPLGKF